MATVYVKKNESGTQQEAEANVEKAIRQLRKKVANENILKETFDRMYYTKPGDLKREKKKAGRRKQLKKMYKEKSLYKG